MGFFDSYFNPEEFEVGRGLLGRLESLQGGQAGYLPGEGFGALPQTGGVANQTVEATAGPRLLPSVNQPMTYPVGNVPIPTPRPSEIPSGNIAIGDYLMPQFGGAPVAQSSPAQPDLGERLGAGFRSWSYTPVGNPFAALANAITGFNTGQFAAAPALASADARSRPAVQSQADDAFAPPASPLVSRAQPIPRLFARRSFLPRR